MTYQLPHFEQTFDIHQLEELYEAFIERDGRELTIDISFDKTSISPSKLERMSDMINALDRYDEKNIEDIKQAYHQPDHRHVSDFVDDVKYYEDYIKLLDGSKPLEPQILDALHLVRVGFYPDGAYGAEYFVIYDYSIGREHTDQLVVVQRDAKGQRINIVTES